MNKFLQFLMLTTVSLNFNICKADNMLLHIGEKAELFKSWHRVQDNYLILTSPPIYQEQDSDSFTKGYRVNDSITIEGQYNREIYDYEKKQSAANVFFQIRKSLKANGYDELFTCEQESCGDVEGWQLYLGTLIGESKNTQYYLAAKKTAIKNKTEEYIALYISEIDSQTRAQFDIVSAPMQHRFDVVIKTNEMLRDIEKDGRVVVDGIFFEIGSSILKPESKDALKLMSQLIKENTNNRFAIVGHADNTGSFDSNMKLSDERAKAVKTALLNQYKVSSKQLSAKGVGTLSPVTSNTDVEGRKQNRRVELVKL